MPSMAHTRATHTNWSGISTMCKTPRKETDGSLKMETTGCGIRSGIQPHRRCHDRCGCSISAFCRASRAQLSATIQQLIIQIWLPQKMLRQTNRSKNSSLQQDSHSKTPIEMESFTQRCLWKSNLFLNEIDLRQEGVRSLVFLQLEV